MLAHFLYFRKKNFLRRALSTTLLQIFLFPLSGHEISDGFLLMDKYAKAPRQKRSNSCEFTLAARRGTL